MNNAKITMARKGKRPSGFACSSNNLYLGGISEDKKFVATHASFNKQLPKETIWFYHFFIHVDGDLDGHTLRSDL
jgi:hypothetical protein